MKPRVRWMPCFELWSYMVGGCTRAYAPTLWQLEKLVRYGALNWHSYLIRCKHYGVTP